MIKSNIVNIDNKHDSLAYKIDSTTEFSLTYAKSLKDMIKNNNNVIDISINVLPKTMVKNIVLVAQLESNGKIIYWNGADMINFNSEDNGWTKIYLSVKLSDIYLNYNNILFKTYIWNKDKGNFYITDYKIQTRYSNPIIYGLVTKTYPYLNSDN